MSDAGIPEDEAAMSVGDAAKFLGVHADTLRDWIARGKLRADKRTVGGHRRFKLETLELFKASLESSEPSDDAA